MKTTDYKKGDVVILKDGNRCARFEYLGEVAVAGRVMSHAYRPLDGETKYALVKDAEGVELAPIAFKVAAEVVGLKWYEKVLQWWKASNRWKHFLFAIPLGAVCGMHFVTGVGLGMEIKDHLYGNKADFTDFALTAAGGVIGHGVMLAIGLDYVIRLLTNLIF